MSASSPHYCIYYSFILVYLLLCIEVDFCYETSGTVDLRIVCPAQNVLQTATDVTSTTELCAVFLMAACLVTTTTAALALVRLLYTLCFKKKFTLFLFAITKSDVDRFQ